MIAKKIMNMLLESCIYKVYDEVFRKNCVCETEICFLLLHVIYTIYHIIYINDTMMIEMMSRLSAVSAGRRKTQL